MKVGKKIKLPYHNIAIMERHRKIEITLGIILIEDDKLLLLQRKEQGDWILPGSLVPLMEDFDDIPRYIGLCGMMIERTKILGVHEIGEHQYMVLIRGTKNDAPLILTEHYSKAEWANISELINYPMKPGQRPIIEDALSKMNLDN